MSDLIERVAVLEDLEKRMADDYVDAARFAEYIRTLPFAEPERKTGKWKVHLYELGRERYECSECKGRCDLEYDFCPNCGADMRGE